MREEFDRGKGQREREGTEETRDELGTFGKRVKEEGSKRKRIRTSE